MGLFDALRGLFGGDGGSDTSTVDDAPPGSPDDAPAAEHSDPGGAAGVRIGPGEEGSPDRFRMRAERLTDDYAWYDLDFSPASLAALDEVVRTEVFDGEVRIETLDPEALSELVSKVGSYFGEVLVRSHDARWTDDDDGWAVTVPVGDGSYEVPVFRVTLEALHEGLDLAAVYESVQPGAMDPDAGEDAPTAAEAAEELADAWPDYDLDFSPGSLARLDDLVAADLATGDVDVEDPEAMADLFDRALPLASYFAETLIRSHDAGYVDDEDSQMAVAVEGDTGTAGVDAIEVAVLVLMNDDRSFSAVYDALLDEVEE